MASPRRALMVIAGLVLVPSTPAQNIITILESGTVIPGMGTVTVIGGISVNNQGHVIVRVQSDNPTPSLRDNLIDENGVVLASAGQMLALPPGASIQNFGGNTMTLNSVANPAFVLGLAGVPGPEWDTGVYYGLPPIMVAQEGSLSTAPQLSAGTLMRSLLYPKINDLDQIFIQAVVDDPNIVGLNDTRALFILDPVAGTQNVIAKTGDLLPGQTLPIASFGGGLHELAFNNAGQVMYQIQTSSSSSIYVDYTKVSQSGGPFIGFGAVSLNNNGDNAFIYEYGGGNGGIISDGKIVVEYAQSLPDVEPFQLQYIGTPMFLGDDGRLVWSNAFGAPAGPFAKGIFVDYSLLVSTGATSIHGSLVQDLTLQHNCFVLSASGQYLVFQATLEGGVSGAYLIDLWQ